MVSRPRSLKVGLGLVSLAAFLAATIPAFSEEQNCPETDTGVSLPSGFCATIFADKVGHARQLAVAPDGTVYVNTWSGVYYGNDKPHDGGFLIALKDTKGTGHADVNVRFGPTFAEGGHGGTGIWLYKNWLYAELNDKIVRYALKDGEVAPTGKAETILSGMPITGDHPMHPFRHRRRRQSVRVNGIGDERLREGEPHAALARQRSLHRARNARRHLALRRQQERSGVLAEGTLCDRQPQRRGLRLRRRRAPLHHPAWPRPAARGLAGAVHRQTGLGAALRGGDRS